MKDGKVIIITGATAGIGKETVKGLIKPGHTIVLPVRNREKANKCMEYWSSDDQEPNIELFDCDLASMDSVRTFADAFKKKYNQLDVLINNAGVWTNEKTMSEDGIEIMFAVNHLAHFILTGMLLPQIKDGGKIINVASEAHRGAKIDTETLVEQPQYNNFRVYAQSKLCNILFTNTLHEKYNKRGIRVNSLHPGFVSTELFDQFNIIFRKFFSLFMIDSVKGAETTLYLATSPEANDISGKYFAKKKPKKPAKTAFDRETAQELWSLSEEITGITY